MKVNKIIKSTGEEELEITGATLLSVEKAEMLTDKEREYNYWWWLRSPGLNSYCAAFVDCCGDFHDNGYFVYYTVGRVRPALQISNLETSNLKIGDTFELGGFEFKVISDNLAWMYKQDIGRCAFNKDSANGNDYETSDIKEFVDKWFEGLKVTS